MSASTAIMSIVAYVVGMVGGMMYFDWLIAKGYKKAQFWSIVAYVILLVAVLTLAAYDTFQCQWREAEGAKIFAPVKHDESHAQQSLTYPILAVGDIRLKGHSRFVSGEDYFAGVGGQGIKQDFRIPQVALVRPFFVSHLRPNFRKGSDDACS